MKKIVSLFLALCMVLTIGAAFAATAGDLTADTTITIDGLLAGDSVKLYKVLEWTDGKGWTATEMFADITGEGEDKSAGLNSYIANAEGAALAAADVYLIAETAQGKNPINADAQAVTGTSFTYTVGAENEMSGVGMYLALVTPGTPGIVYNPIIVSADFDRNDTNSIATTEKIVGTAVAKKQTIKLEKTEPKITSDVGKDFEFTIETTIPVYAESFTDTFFQVTDTISDYLDLKADTIVVKDKKSGEPIDVDDYKTTSAHGFSIRFPHTYLKARAESAGPQDIIITYKATLNVPLNQLTNIKEENNEVTVEFPNDPNDSTGKKVTALKDGTREYTFTIDGKLFGDSSWDTSELVKVALDEKGNYITQVVNYKSGEDHGPLEGAKFGLYTSEQAAKDARDDQSKWNTGLYTNKVFDGFVDSSELGLLTISGLDAGVTYYLVELTAPAGYIKDQDVHTIEIIADINGDEDGEDGLAVTEYYTVNETTGAVSWSTTQTEGSIPYTYYVPVLESYTVKVDGSAETKYDYTASGPHISTQEPLNPKDTELDNTKGVELPHTGGIGTTIFYILGGVLVIGAAVILVARRKAHD